VRELRDATLVAVPADANRAPTTDRSSGSHRAPTADRAGDVVDHIDDVQVVGDALPDPPIRSTSSIRLSRYFAAISGAVLVALVVVVAALVRPVNSPGLAGAVNVLPAHLQDVCAAPTSMFARFWDASTVAPADYSTAVRVGTTNLPAPTMYISDGPPGGGVLCVVAPSPSGPDQPQLAAALARPGAVAYIADYQFAPFGAVRPGVARVTIEVAGTADLLAFTIGGSGAMQLQDIGHGWHVFDSPMSFGANRLTVRAYNAHNQLLEMATVTVTGKPSSAATR
jgi:hypothetical protein